MSGRSSSHQRTPDPYAEARCTCGHLDTQHGTNDDVPYARAGCWWCPDQHAFQVPQPPEGGLF